MSKTEDEKFVDEFFSFIYDHDSTDDDEATQSLPPTIVPEEPPHSTSTDNHATTTQPSSIDHITQASNLEVEVPLDSHQVVEQSHTISGCVVDSTEDTDHLSSNGDQVVPEDVDTVVDDHFAFLKDESLTEEFFSLNEEEEGTEQPKERDYENVSFPPRCSSKAPEPIYSNVGARPKLKNKIDGIDSEELLAEEEEPLYENIETLSRGGDGVQVGAQGGGNSTVSSSLASGDNSNVASTTSSSKLPQESATLVPQISSVYLSPDIVYSSSIEEEDLPVEVSLKSIEVDVRCILESGVSADLEKLHSLDMELSKLEQIGSSSTSVDTNAVASTFSSSFTVPSISEEEEEVVIKEAPVPPEEDKEDRISSHEETLEEDRGAKRKIETADCSSSKRERSELHLSLLQRQSSFEEDPQHPFEEDLSKTTQSARVCSEEAFVKEEDEEVRGVASAREARRDSILRRSMKRMRHIRLSGRRSRNRAKASSSSSSPRMNLSEETEGRREVPSVPQLGLPSVRSPSTSATLLPSLLAAFTPHDGPPRETLPSPQEVIQQSSQQRPSSAPQGSLQSPSWVIPPTVSPRPSTGGHQGRRSSNQNTRSPIRPSTTNQIPRSSIGATSTNQSPVRDFSSNPSSDPEVPNRDSSIPPEHSRRCSIASVPNRTNSITPLIPSTASNPPPHSTRRVRTARSATASPVRQTATSDIRRPRSRRRPTSGRSHGFKYPVRWAWPHGHSGLMATLAVTLNVFNISRFAVLGAQFGWLFPVQWLILSFVIGLPLMTFHAAIGQATGGSVTDMWVISPIFQGIGYSLLFVEVVLGMYCCVPVAWLFTYFRDSFDMRHFRCLSAADCEGPSNLTNEINSVVSGYFSSIVLQRSEGNNSFVDSLGSVKFDLSFNLALIWVITFLALSRGGRSYGKICYPILLLPLCGYLALCFYLAHWTNRTLDGKQLLVKFIDRQSWLVASREAFLVWGLHAAVTQQMAAGHKKNHPLWRDTTCLALLTALGLGLASFCGLLCFSVLDDAKVSIIPSSFEKANYREFVDPHLLFKDPETIMKERNDVLGPPQYLRTEPAFHNFYVGIRIRDEYKMRRNPNLESTRSGYNCIRFLTELFPALLFAKEELIFSVWPPIFYLSLLLFGLAHQLAVWHTVVQGIIRIHSRLSSWDTFITFCLCVLGFSGSLLMATGAGIHIIYFLDFAIGGLWWIMILQLIMVFAILFVRGRPFAAKDLAFHLLGKCCSTTWLMGPVAFSWTIMIPVGLLVLSISFFKTGNYREVFAWSSMYWSTWTCQLASSLQLFPLLVVPLVGLIQTCRYLADPRQDLFERIQHLYRPPPLNQSENVPVEYNEYDINSPQETSTEEEAPRPFSDPPPKYTPPPSYSTATGSGLSKLLNYSFRRLRNTLRNQSTTSTERLDTPHDQAPYIPPPDYLPPRIDSYSPPQYATLDPLRMRRAMDAFYTNKPPSIVQLHLPPQLRRRQNSCRYCGVFFVLTQPPDSGGPSRTPDPPSDNESISSTDPQELSDASEKATPPECGNPQCPGPSPSIRGSLSRSLRSSIRRSARRLAHALSGGTPRTPRASEVLVSHISQNSLDQSHSEA